GDDLAQLAAGRVEGERGGGREDERPQQQRAFLARPHRRKLVEHRRLERGVFGDDVEREVVGREADLDDHDAGQEQAEDRVDAAPGERHPTVVVAPDDGGHCGGDGDEEGQRKKRVADVSHYCRNKCCCWWWIRSRWW